MDYIEINRKLWNNKTNIHYTSEFYDVASFLKGKDSLNSIELDLLGNIHDKRILHLQCHFGQDTISLSRHGACVTGVDFSDNAILKAKELAQKAGTTTSFIESDIYSLKEKITEKFDIVFTSYGVIGWLPCMTKWAEIVQHFLKPGGVFIMVEFHPVVWMFSYDFKSVEFNYMDSNPIVENLEGTYTDRNADINDTSIAWNHGLCTVMNSLIHAGITIVDFQEYNYSPYNCFNKTVKVEERKYQIQGLENKLPMVYSIKGIKQ